MDNLTRDAVAAKKAGMTYGKWKAMQDTGPIVTVPRGGMIRTCKFCGKEFRQYDKRQRLYCDDVCKYKQNYRRIKERMAEDGK
jgi:hypothetical protein